MFNSSSNQILYTFRLAHYVVYPVKISSTTWATTQNIPART